MDFELATHSSGSSTAANKYSAHKQRPAGRILKQTRHALHGGGRRGKGSKRASEQEPNKKSKAEMAALAVHGANAPPDSAQRLHRAELSSGHHAFQNDAAFSGKVGFVDEEAIFNVPLLVDSMAEGMLLTPPAMKKGFNWSQFDGDDDVVLVLWGD